MKKCVCIKKPTPIDTSNNFSVEYLKRFLVLNVYTAKLTSKKYYKIAAEPKSSRYYNVKGENGLKWYFSEDRFHEFFLLREE